jgi:hypothetical protein
MLGPTKHGPSLSPDSGEQAGLSGRPAISLAAFKATAVEVAQQLEEPIAICRRPETDAGIKALPFANKPLAVAKADGSEILDVVYPPAKEVNGERPDSTDLHGRVVESLRGTPGGQKLDDYFGISSGSAEQPPAEAAKSEELIGRLKAFSQGQGGDIESILGEISEHAASSGADSDALRALMRGSKESKTENGGRAG